MLNASTVLLTVFAGLSSAAAITIPANLYGHFDQTGSGLCADADNNSFACGPVATANSMLMLDNMYGSSLIGDQDGNGVIDNVDVGSVAFELSLLMGCTACNKGTTVADMIFGKIAYLDANSPNVDYYVHSHASPSIQWFFDELTRGQDIEVLVGFYDEDGERIGGHFITLNGISAMDAGASIDFIDPAGGADRSSDIYEIDDQTLGTTYGVGGMVDGKVIETTVVEYGIAESVPEPGTPALLALGLVGLAGLGIRGGDQFRPD